MQRDIKFRFFDTLRNYTFTTEDMKPYEVWDCVQDDRFNVMQFTGLKDKNGVEIYEGDILSSTRYIGGHYLDTLTDNVVVSFHNYKWAIQPAKRNLLKPQPITELEDDCEVIGNIYENPELLGGSNG